MENKKVASNRRTCLYFIGNHQEAVKTLAKVLPEEKNSVMELLLNEKDILPLLNHDRLSVGGQLKLCAAYKNQASRILAQLIPDEESEPPFGLSKEAYRCYRLLKETNRDYLNYQDFFETFPEQAKEIFSRLSQDNNFFLDFSGGFQHLKKLLHELPQYRSQLITLLMSQSDDYWREEFKETWFFYYIAMECPEQKDTLINRYFEVNGLYKEYYHFEGADVTIAKLLNLALEKDEYGRNTFGIKIFEMLLNHYPEHHESFIKLLCENPKALAGLLAGSPLENFIILINLSPDSKNELLLAAQKLEAYPGVFGLFTHQVVDTKSEDHAWAHPSQIVSLCDNFSEYSLPFIQTLFNDNALLSKVLSNPYIGVKSAFLLALKFPQYKNTIIGVFWESRRDTSSDTLTEEGIQSAPAALQPFLALLTKIRPGDDYGNMALFSAMSQYPSLMNDAMEYFQKHSVKPTDTSYEDQFPKELWPWLNLLKNRLLIRESNGLIKSICELFPQYKSQLIKFFLTHEEFRSILFESLENVCDASTLAPELQEALLESQKTHLCLGMYHKPNLDKLLLAFPGREQSVMEILFNNEKFLSEFLSVGISELINFAHDYPQHQAALVSALYKFPGIFKELLYSPEMIYPLLLLFPNRKLFCSTFCEGASTAALNNSDLNNTLEALHLIPNLSSYFINYLFNIPGYAQVFCNNDFEFRTTSKLTGHEIEIISHLCATPQVIDRLASSIDDEAFLRICPAPLIETIRLSHSLYHAVLNDDISSIESLQNSILNEFNVGTIERAQVRCLVKFVERLLKGIQPESPGYQPLKDLHEKLISHAIPPLTMFSANVVKDKTTVDVSKLPEDIKRWFK